MAQEVDPVTVTEVAADTPGETSSETVPVETAAPAESSWSFSLLALAFVAVVLSLPGVFALARPVPAPMTLGLGLLLWGLLDLTAQRRGFMAWKGSQAAIGNGVNLARGLGLLALGVWLCLMGLGLIHPVNSAVIVSTGVGLAALYLASALGLEMMVHGLRLRGQAFLLASLILMLFSYYYFTIPFTYSWAAVFALLAFAAGAWSLRLGVLAESPSLGAAVLLAVLALGIPLMTYTFQQAYGVEEQRLFTPTLLVPRMRQVLTGIGDDPGQLQWAPSHTQSAQPGDVRFSDKVAFVDHSRGQETLKLFQQHEDGLREILRVSNVNGISLTAFSMDGGRLAYTWTKTTSTASALAVLEPLSRADAAVLAAQASVVNRPVARPPFSFRHFFAWLRAVLKTKHHEDVDPRQGNPLAYRSRSLYANVLPGPSHGQVWRDLGHQLYFSAPPGGPRNPATSVLRVDFSRGSVTNIQPGRALPAVSPDGRSLLSVGFIPRQRFLEMADLKPVNGLNSARDERPFVPDDEAGYFPAWNESQTEVLFLEAGTGRLMTMDSNGKNHRPFDPKALDSKYWRSAKQVPFRLQWVEVGDRFNVYRSLPDGSDERLVYETQGSDISAPQWSADGKRIAFIARNADVSQVITVGSDGSWPRHFFTTKDALDELKWSPDSGKVAWICRRTGGAEEIWTAGYEGMDPVRVHEDEGSLKDLAWSPEGKHLAVQQTSVWGLFGLRLVRPDLQNVLMVDLVDRHARVMTRYGLMSRDPSFSPHGDSIAYFTDQHIWNPRPARDRSSSLVISQLY